jgi:hypothetical protein
MQVARVKGDLGSRRSASLGDGRSTGRESFAVFSTILAKQARARALACRVLTRGGKRLEIAKMKLGVVTLWTNGWQDTLPHPVSARTALREPGRRESSARSSAQTPVALDVISTEAKPLFTVVPPAPIDVRPLAAEEGVPPPPKTKRGTRSQKRAPAARASEARVRGGRASRSA